MPTTRSNAPTAELRRGGFTLLELLVVMSIVATLLGLGAGVFGNLSTADRVATGAIQDAFRAARLFAQRETAPAGLLVLPEEGRVVGFGLRALGGWHFEDEAGSGWPVDAAHEPEALAPDGVIGSCLVLDGAGGLSVSDLPPAHDAPGGFGVDVFLRPDAEPRPMTLLERKGSWSLGLDEEGTLGISLRLVGGDAPEEFRLDVPGRALPPGRFTRLTVVFDGRALHVALDGARAVPDTLFAEARRLAIVPGAPVGTGAGATAYRGAIDELRLMSVVSSPGTTLPSEVQLEGGARLLRLDASGHLDPAHHRAPERVSFVTGEPPRRTVVECGLLGGLRTWTEAP